MIAAVLCLGAAACSGQVAIPENWYVRNSPATNDLNGVASGGGLFVAAGKQGALLTSSNGIDWTASYPAGSVPTFFCATYGSFYYFDLRSLYLLGGSGTALIVGSGDSVSWTNGLSGADSQQVYGMVYGFGAFEAVARDLAANTSYLLSSASGTNWQASSLPTTNVLRAIAPAVASVGSGRLPGVQFVAVGDSGTILTTPNGTSWARQNSGTTVTLRAAVYHQGQMLVGGDDGVVLSSTDGTNWSAAPPTSFDIHGLASSGNALVAVGDYLGSGRLQASVDGHTWSGSGLVLSNSLNAVAYGKSSFVAVGDGGFIVQSSYAPDSTVNSWLKTTSGYWEEPFWSCGRLPAPDQGSVLFTNAGWKALAIGQNTTANHSNSLMIQSLTIDAPTNSFNQLLLNYAGTNVPLTVDALILRTNASLVSYYSGVVASYLELDSPVLFAESSQLNADSIDDYARLNLSNSFASARVAFVHQNSAVEQSGGTSQFDTIAMEANSRFSVVHGGFAVNYLQVQYPFFNALTNGKATFVFDGGDMFVNSLILGAPSYGIEGDFLFKGGNLACSNYSIWNGIFEQSGGTNAIAALALPPGLPYGAFLAEATYRLSAGTLLTTNLSLGQYDHPETHISVIYPGNYVQSGGVHTNASLVLHGFLFSPDFGYSQTPQSAGFVSLSGGLLVSSNETVTGEFTQTGGTNQVQLLSISGGGSYSMATGTLATAQTLIWGYQRIMSPYSSYSCAPATVFVQQSGAHTVANLLAIEGFATYEVDTGTLAAQDILADTTSQLLCRSGSVSNWGTFTLEGGNFVPGDQSHFLGQLRLWAVTNYYASCVNTGAVSLDLSGPSGTVLRFRDSSSAVWTGPGLLLSGWQPWTGTGGSHHIFFGTNAQGLTPAQLTKITFVNPSGWPPGNYRARILDTGEVVPGAPGPPITLTRGSGGLILSWPGNYQLLSATNVLGPYTVVSGAVSPTTNAFTAPQGFFHLSLPRP